MHKYARKAAAAALTADSMGKFWEFHEALYKNSRQLNDKKVSEIAKNLGLDPDKFIKEMESEKIQNKIKQDMIDGDKADLRATPSVYINGKLLNHPDLDSIQEMIDAQFKK